MTESLLNQIDEPCQEKSTAGVSPVFLRALFPKVEAELKSGLFPLEHIVDSSLVGKEEIVASIGNGIVEE